jgi:uracil-DNA glycosylase
MIKKEYLDLQQSIENKKLMDVKIENSWKHLLSSEFEKEYFLKLTQFVKSEYSTNSVYPKGNQIFQAFDKCPFEKVKVVILGQDPYHEPGQAHGLCFSVPESKPFPPSLQNIFKEIRNDMGYEPFKSGDLTRWSEQGILLLNSTLTVRAHIAGSHQNKGWESFTDSVIHKLAENREGLVFILWGSYAQKKCSFIDENKHLVLKSVHPSPLSAHRGFFGNHQFSKTNEWLISKGLEPIDWH